MNTVASRIMVGRRGETQFTRRRRLNASASQVSNRQARFTDLRYRRRRGVLWAILAALAMFGAWDIACRLDEVVYNAVFPSHVLEARHEAMR